MKTLQQATAFEVYLSTAKNCVTHILFMNFFDYLWELHTIILDYSTTFLPIYFETKLDAMPCILDCSITETKSWTWIKQKWHRVILYTIFPLPLPLNQCSLHLRLSTEVLIESLEKQEACYKQPPPKPYFSVYRIPTRHEI